MKPTAMPSFQIGIWRSSSGVREARCSSASVSRTRARRRVDLVDEQEARDVRLLELAQHDLERRDLPLVRLADHDGGVAGRQRRCACRAETPPSRGNRRRSCVSPRKRDRRHVRLDAHARGRAPRRSASPTRVAVRRRGPGAATAPVRSRMASRRVVLPLWNGPTMAMHRGPASDLPFCAIDPFLPVAAALLRGAPERMRLPVVCGWQESFAGSETA